MEPITTQLKAAARERFARRRSGRTEADILHGIPLNSRFRFQFPVDFIEASQNPDFWRTRNNSNYTARTVHPNQVIFHSNQLRKVTNLSIDELTDFIDRGFIKPLDPIKLQLPEVASC
jgi:hypothetical protein